MFKKKLLNVVDWCSVLIWNECSDVTNDIKEFNCETDTWTVLSNLFFLRKFSSMSLVVLSVEEEVKVEIKIKI